MTDGIGPNWAVFAGLTIGVMGFAAFMTGRAIANTWRPQWQVIVYGLLLGCADRFLNFALFGGDLLSLGRYLIDSAAILAIGIFAFRSARAGKMVRQYPWLYTRDGLFSWRDRS